MSVCMCNRAVSCEYGELMVPYFYLGMVISMVCMGHPKVIRSTQKGKEIITLDCDGVFSNEPIFSSVPTHKESIIRFIST